MNKNLKNNQENQEYKKYLEELEDPNYQGGSWRSPHISSTGNAFHGEKKCKVRESNL